MMIDIAKARDIILQLKDGTDWKQLQLQKDILVRITYALHRNDIERITTLTNDEREELFGLIHFIDFIQDSVVDIGLVDEKIVFDHCCGECIPECNKICYYCRECHKMSREEHNGMR